MAMRGPLATIAPLLRGRSGLGRDDLAAVIVAAGVAEVVRALELTAVRALLERRRGQRVMAAAHVPLGGRRFSLRDSHAAPLNALSSIKIATILRLVPAGQTRGGGRIVANRRPYSETGAKRNPVSGGGERRVADQRVGAAFVAEGRHRPMAGNEGRVVAHRPQFVDDRADELLLVAAREIPAPDRAAEQDVADQRQIRIPVVEDDMAGRVPGAVADREGQLASVTSSSSSSQRAGVNGRPGMPNC